MPPRVRYSTLPTERVNAASHALDRMTPRQIARLMNREDARVVRAVGRVSGAVAEAVTLVIAAVRGGGRVFFVGAGTSGRMGVLEAAECPPTFGTAPDLVQAFMAGGRASVFRSREGAEDDARGGRRAVRGHVTGRDVVIGVSASGVTPFVRAALVAARARRARTILVTCNPTRSYGRLAQVVIAPAPGPEVLAGSTRLKAGTATKLVLNTLTTATMARLGKVYGNRMVDLVPRSRKLRERAVTLVETLAAASRPRARAALAAGRGRVPVAVVMLRAGLGAQAAASALAVHDNSLRSTLQSLTRHPARRSRR